MAKSQNALRAQPPGPVSRQPKPQTVAVPDKGTLNRVRLGPFATVDEMNQIKAELLKRGVTTAVIKIP